jgi:hypothetical protein
LLTWVAYTCGISLRVSEWERHLLVLAAEGHWVVRVMVPRTKALGLFEASAPCLKTDFENVNTF